MQSDVWIKWDSDNNPQSGETVNRNMLGYVWPEGKVLFPDFFKNATIDWWSNEIAIYYNNMFKFAGLWIGLSFYDYIENIKMVNNNLLKCRCLL